MYLVIFIVIFWQLFVNFFNVKILWLFFDKMFAYFFDKIIDYFWQNFWLFFDKNVYFLTKFMIIF